MNESVTAFWQDYLDTLPAGHPHRRARPDVSGFGDSPRLADELAALVVAGRKRASASLPAEFNSVGDPLPVAGDASIVLRGDGMPVAIIESVEVRQVPFQFVDAAFAADEGEGDRSLAWWQAAHRKYFGRVAAALGVAFDEDAPVICRRFRRVWPAGAMQIRLDDLRGPEIRALLEEHLQNMRSLSPPESVHALDLEGLRRPDITFWTAWSGSALLGCGALKEIDSGHGEVKSMRTSAAHRRAGVARSVLTHIMDEARRRKYLRLSLETGSQPVFEPARRLYESFGFSYCAPFEGYSEDPNSAFMTRRL